MDSFGNPQGVMSEESMEPFFHQVGESVSRVLETD
jgi:hypothetical protein